MNKNAMLAGIGALLTLFVSSKLGAQSPDSSDNSNGDFKPPLHYWKFDEVSDNHLSPDSGTAGHKIPATLTGAKLAPGKFGQAVDFPITGTVSIPTADKTITFDGNVEALVTIPLDLNTLSVKGVTVSFWFKGVIPANGYSSLFDSGRKSGLEIRINSMKLIILNAAENWNFIKTPSTPAGMPDQWTHVAVTSADNKVALYVNGALVDSQENVAAPTFQDHVTLGGIFEKGSSGLPNFTSGFVGDLDDLMIFDYVLTPDQIKSLSAGKRMPDSDAPGGL